MPGHDAPRPNPWAALMITGAIGALTFAIVKVDDRGWPSPGIVCFTGGQVYLATVFGAEPDMTAAIIATIPSGIGVGLLFPTLMGVSASPLPPSSFATGSGVINMIRPRLSN